LDCIARLRRPNVVEDSGEVCPDDFLGYTRWIAALQQLIGNDLDLSRNIESYDVSWAVSELVPNDAEGRTYAQVIAAVLAKKAIRGDKGAAVELADRAEGRPRQAVDATAVVTVADRHPLEDLSDEELQARREALLKVIEGDRKRPSCPTLPEGGQGPTPKNAVPAVA